MLVCGPKSAASHAGVHVLCSEYIDNVQLLMWIWAEKVLAQDWRCRDWK